MSLRLVAEEVKGKTKLKKYLTGCVNGQRKKDTLNSEKEINELKTRRFNRNTLVQALERDQGRGRERGGLGIEGEDLKHGRRGFPTTRPAHHHQIHLLGPPDPRPARHWTLLRPTTLHQSKPAKICFRS